MTSNELREKFPIGCRVKVAEGKMISGKATTGVVVGYGIRENMIHVMRTQRQTPRQYHCDLWELWHGQ